MFTLWCGVSLVRGVHLFTLCCGVCEVFTCSPCGVVCVRCTLVHLVVWYLRGVHLMVWCVRCSLVRLVVCVRCSLVHFVVCEVFTCGCGVCEVFSVHLFTLFNLWCGVCEVYTCSPCGVVCVRCSLVHLVVWCV